MTEKIDIFYRHWSWEKGKYGKKLGYIVKHDVKTCIKMSDLAHEIVLEAYRTYLPNGTEVGDIYRTRESEWSSIPFAGDIGHSFIDTRDDAARDVIRAYMELTQ